MRRIRLTPVYDQTEQVDPLIPRNSRYVLRVTMTRDEDRDTADRPLRADAARNRELILDTARRLFAERGLSVTLNDIAHEAGVGVGTVYRRFADKDAVVEALMAAKFVAMADIAARARAVDDPEQALRTYLMGVFEYRARDRAIAEVIVRAGRSKPAVVRERERLDAEVSAIIDRARDAGCLREGMTSLDVPLLTLMVGVVADRTRGCEPDVWRRYAEILIDGVMVGADPAPLPGEPLDRVALDQAMHPA